MKQQTSFQVVLSLRRRKEDAAERTLAEALANLQRAQLLLATLEDDLRRTRCTSLGETGELLHVMELQQRHQRIRHLEQACGQATQALAEQQAAVTREQQTYLEAHREREVVDALLKQQATAEQAKQNRRDVKVSEDLFLGRLIRGYNADESVL